MAQDRSNFNPEKQLLKLIEEQGDGLPRETSRRKGIKFFSFGVVRGRFLFFRDKIREYLRVKRGPLRIRIREINKILVLSLIILVRYFFVDVVGSINALDKVSVLAGGPLKGQNKIVSTKPSLLKKSSYYSEKVRLRDIFKFVIYDVSKIDPDDKEKTRPPIKRKGPTIAELIKNIRFVGTARDPGSGGEMIAFIEYKKNPAKFLKSGQKINKMKILKVFKNKIILKYKEEIMELKLRDFSGGG
jgi:hypothetical protein